MSETVQPCGFWKLAGVQCRGGEGGCSRNVNKDCIKAEASSFVLFFFFGCCVMLYSIDWILARVLITSAVTPSSFLLTSVCGGLHMEWGNDYFDPGRVAQYPSLSFPLLCVSLIFMFFCSSSLKEICVRFPLFVPPIRKKIDLHWKVGAVKTSSTEWHLFIQQPSRRHSFEQKQCVLSPPYAFEKVASLKALILERID